MDINTKLIVKVQFNDEIRKMPIHNEDITYDELTIMMERVFKHKLNAEDEIIIKYRDEDNDLITISDDSDLAFAIESSNILKLSLTIENDANEETQKSNELTSGEIATVRKDLQSIRDQVNRLLDRLVHAHGDSAANATTSGRTSAVGGKDFQEIGGKEFDPLSVGSNHAQPMAIERIADDGKVAGDHARLQNCHEAQVESKEIHEAAVGNINKNQSALAPMSHNIPGQSQNQSTMSNTAPTMSQNMPYNQNMPQHMNRQNMSPSMGGQNLPPNMQNMSHNFAGQNMPTSIGQNMPANYGGQNMPANYGGQNLPPNMGGQNLPPNMGGGQNMPPNMGGGQNMPPNMGGQNMPPNMGGQNMPPNNMGGQNISPNMGGQNMPPNVGAPNMPPTMGGGPNMPPNMGAQNMPPNMGGGPHMGGANVQKTMENNPMHPMANAPSAFTGNANATGYISPQPIPSQLTSQRHMYPSAMQPPRASPSNFHGPANLGNPNPASQIRTPGSYVYPQNPQFNPAMSQPNTNYGYQSTQK